MRRHRSCVGLVGEVGVLASGEAIIICNGNRAPRRDHPGFSHFLTTEFLTAPRPILYFPRHHNHSSMQAELHLVDAFTRSAFRGNTAGVCIPDGPADAAWMQQVAAELKHSETAFLFPEGENWNLRWFTPAKEVELCGHATLAAASVLCSTGRVPRDKAIVFETLSGNLTVRQDGDWISMDFPAEPAATSMPVPGLGRRSGSSRCIPAEPVRYPGGTAARGRCLQSRTRHGRPLRHPCPGHHRHGGLRSPAHSTLSPGSLRPPLAYRKTR